MKDGVHIAGAGTQAIEDGADGIHDAAEQHKQQPLRTDGPHQLGDTGQDGPAADQMADHLRDFILIHANGGQRYPKRGEGARYAKQNPAQRAADAYQRHGDIGAPDQHEHVAMVDDPHHLFALQIARKRMINAGNGVQDDHGCAKHRAGDLRQRPLGLDHHHRQRYDAQGRADAVGYGVEYLFAQRIQRDPDVQFFSCLHHHIDPPFIYIDQRNHYT